MINKEDSAEDEMEDYQTLHKYGEELVSNILNITLGFISEMKIRSDHKTLFLRDVVANYAVNTMMIISDPEHAEFSIARNAFKLQETITAVLLVFIEKEYANHLSNLPKGETH